MCALTHVPKSSHFSTQDYQQCLRCQYYCTVDIFVVVIRFTVLLIAWSSVCVYCLTLHCYVSACLVLCHIQFSTDPMGTSYGLNFTPVPEEKNDKRKVFLTFVAEPLSENVSAVVANI